MGFPCCDCAGTDTAATSASIPNRPRTAAAVLLICRMDLLLPFVFVTARQNRLASSVPDIEDLPRVSNRGRLATEFSGDVSHRLNKLIIALRRLSIRQVD